MIASERLTALEVRAAEQERTIEELSGQVAEQWKTIERLERKLAVLTDRLRGLEDGSAPDIPDGRPPHW